MLLLIQKTLKSLQAHLDEFLWQLAAPGPVRLVQASALTHARAKLLPSAFVELNERVLLAHYYHPAQNAGVRRWRGHRLLSIDSSLTRLPDSAQLRAHFGVVECANQHGVQESYPQARISILYDLLNQLGWAGKLVKSTQAEAELAHQHLEQVQPGDVLLTDRGYSGYGWFVAVWVCGAHFIGRCSRSSFPIVQELFARDEAGVSVIVTLQAPKELRAQCRARGWPLKLQVRFVTVRLSTGKLEVVATSLWDETLYPTETFGPVYGQRWGHETYYGRLKGRLDLEHFSGKTVAAAEQDFAALLFLSNVESVVIGPAQEQLAQGSAQRQQPRQVNRAVSLHAIKHRLIELLASPKPAEEVLAQLTECFLHSPVSVRAERQVPRRIFSPSRSYHYQRRVRKIVF
jgi:hypothetical protein